MKKIAIDKIADGMILAKPVVGQSGNVLLSEGVVLSSKITSKLSSWGVAMVYVEGEDENSVIQASTENISKELQERFGESLKYPLMKTIYRVIEKVLTERNKK